MSVTSEVKYQLRFTCDGCGSEDYYQSQWELMYSDHAHLPPGWAHFSGVRVLRINDVCRTGQELDFCGDCVTRKNIQFLIDNLPFDNRSLKTTVIPGSDHDTRAPGRTG